MSADVLVITGPTATGKTRLGVSLARAYGGEVVSVDSMQVYRQMDIGTAKPTLQEMDGVPHHMIDVADPSEDYSVARYVEQASACVDDILSRNKLPVLVGGTGLYLDALLAGRSFAARAEDPALRADLERRAAAEGGEALLSDLAKVDPESAARLHPNDVKRIVRALEVYSVTGIPLSVHHEASRRVPPRYAACQLALSFAAREDLYARINQRVDEMISSGLVEEVQGLLSRGLSPRATSMQAIGYKELCAAIAGEMPLADAVSEIKLRSRQYAKRQITWLRRKTDLNWILWGAQPDFEQALHISTHSMKASGLL
ncbi:MAG: tRNA (adenosine(37)-N6)-dimethylallyltransferase MiaA [Oscillospiraceae bacterium]|nr:tRNA (adenosine(37)-N6)-dimethylallyltransferase MiaA [Oscillospiraceae bacterium]